MNNIPVLSVLLPVKNENESLPIIARVLLALIPVPCELLIITDDPQDSSIPVIQELEAQFVNIRHIDNTLGKGVYNAVRSGVESALGKYILIYAADEIGPVLSIPKMLYLLDQGCDFVSGTRYAKGGKRYGGSKVGHLLSKSANSLFNFFTATALSDCTTGLKMFKKSIFHNFLLTDVGSGWSFAFDFSILAQTIGLKIGEVPIVSIDRLFGGKSSMNLVQWIRSYSKCFIKGFVALPIWKSSRPKLEKIALTE